MDRAELEALIREDPYDEGRWMVLEDFLLEEEDARAPLIRCEKEHLRDDAIELRRRLGESLLGERHESLDKAIVGEWRAGYLVECAVLGRTKWAVKDYARDLGALFASPAAGLVRQLTIDIEAAREVAIVGTLLAAAACAPALRTLVLSGFWTPATEGAALDPAWLDRLALRRLFLVGRAIRLPPGRHLARLRSLRLTPGHPSELHDLFGRNALPELRELAIGTAALEVLHPATSESPHAFRRLLSGIATPALDQLRVDASAMLASALLPELERSPLLSQLGSLSLGDHRVTPRDFGPRFAHLDVLVLPAGLSHQ